MPNLKQISLLLIGLGLFIFVISAVSYIFYQRQIGPEQRPTISPNPGWPTSQVNVTAKMRVIFIAYTPTPQPTFTPTPSPMATHLPPRMNCPIHPEKTCVTSPASLNSSTCTRTNVTTNKHYIIVLRSPQGIVQTNFVPCVDYDYNLPEVVTSAENTENTDTKLDVLETLYRLFRQLFWQ
jgi:hypothetical protein